MKLYSRVWLRPVRRAVAAAAKGSPRGRRAASRRFWTRHRELPPWVARVAVTVCFAHWADRPSDPGWVLEAFALWATMLLLWRAHELQDRLSTHRDMTVFLTLPVGDEWVFTFYIDEVRRGALWLGADALALYGTLAMNSGAAPALLAAALVAAAAQWLANFAGATLLFRLWPRGRFAVLALFWLPACLGLLMLEHAGLLEPGFFSGALARLAMGTPAGWIQSVFRSAWGGGSGLLYALPALALLASLPGNLRALRARCRYRDIAPEGAPPVPDDDDVEEEELLFGKAGSAPMESPAVAIEAVEHGEWRAALSVTREGHIERLLLRVLNARERHVFDFLRGGDSHWDRRWWRSLQIALGGVLLLALSRRLFGPGDMMWVFLPWNFLLIVCPAPLFGGVWPGLSLRRLGQRECAICSVLPVGYAELSRVIWKANTIRFLAAAPLFLGGAAFDGWWLAHAPLEGAWVGAKLVLVAMALQPLILILPFSQGTNDASGGCLGALLWAAAITGVLITCPVAIGYILSAPWGGLLVAPLALLAWLAGRLYRRAYERGWFDLLTVPRS